MASQVQLRNVAYPPRPITFHKPHDLWCAVIGSCTCTSVSTGAVRADPTSRRRVVDARRVRLAGTETIFARGTEGDVSKPLDRAVLNLPEVAAAIAKRELVAEDVKEPEAQPPAAASPAPTEAPSKPAATAAPTTKAAAPDAAARAGTNQ